MAEYLKLAQAEQEDAYQRDANLESINAREESKWKRSEIFKHKEKRIDRSPMYLRPWTAFYIFAAANTIAAVYSPIQDCDEVFNYWEPTHYLDRGYGFETWEYSPEFAIRSWAYAGVHALVAFFGRIGLLVATKAFQFYFLRFALGLAMALCQARFYAQVSRTFNARIGAYVAIVMLSSPGFFHANVAYLPSGFAMGSLMLGAAAFMDWRGGLNTAGGIGWIAAGSILGWPFAGAMIIPFMAEEFLFAYFTDSWRELGIRCLYGTTRTTLIGAIQFLIELTMYRKPVVIPFNIIKYNVLAAAQGKGPNIYGTEPWHFYIRNLVLNFHLFFFLALLAMPLVWYQEFVLKKASTKQSYIRNITFVSPLYLWLIIFTIQPHKEERFMYPAYPFIAFNAAVSAHLLLRYVGSNNKSTFTQVVPAPVRLSFVTPIIIGAIVLGWLRMIGISTAYDAPLSVYKPLHEHKLAHSGDTVCLGKEWYRFPGSYHLPQGVRAKFVKSAFSGLLPGEFSEANRGFGLFPGTWLVPPGMNDENIEDVGKYYKTEHCSFMVDSQFEGQNSASTLEPDYVNDYDNWNKILCVPFMDPQQTGLIARLIWVPDWPIIPEQYKRKWGKYCLLQRKQKKRPPPGVNPPIHA